MAYPLWPAALPAAQQEGSNTGDMFSDALETDMDGGNVRKRRRPWQDMGRKSLSFRFDAAQTVVWSTFVRDTLENGTKRFVMPISVDGLACEYRVVQIIGTPSYNGRSGQLRLFSFDAYIMPADMTPRIPDARTQAYVARMSVAPSEALTTAIDDLVLDLVADGLWDKLDVLHLFCLHTAQAGLINAVSSSFTAINNGCVFTAGSGFSGSGVATAYIDTAFAPASASGHWAQTSAQFSVTIGALGSDAAPLVTRAATGVANYLNYTTTPTLTARVNKGSSGPTSAAALPSGATVTATRTGNVTDLYVNGVSAATETLAPDALDANNILLLGNGSNGTNTPMRVFACGSGFTATDAALYRAHVNSFLSAI